MSLLAEGHILVEDYPGVGKTALARALVAHARLPVRARAVHRRPAPGRHRRRQHLQPARAALRVPARPDLRQRRAGRRDQPRLAQDAVRPARVHAGAPRHRRRALARAGAAVHGLRDAEPGRVRGHLSAARGAGRPLHGAALARLSRRPRTRPACWPATRAATACSTSRRSSIATRCSTRRTPRAGCTPRARCATTSSRCVRHTRDDHRVELGASPRAGLMLLRAAKAHALVNGRDHALPDDVQALAPAGALAPDHARPRGRGGRARRGRRRRGRGDAGALGAADVRSALGCAALGLLLLLVAGTFDAEPLYVTGAALVLLGAGAAGLDRPRRVGRPDPPHDRHAQRGRGGAAAGPDRGHARAPAAAARAGSTSRCCPSRCG